jgi:hypothetical protein
MLGTTIITTIITIISNTTITITITILGPTIQENIDGTT